MRGRNPSAETGRSWQGWVFLWSLPFQSFISVLLLRFLGFWLESVSPPATSLLSMFKAAVRPS